MHGITILYYLVSISTAVVAVGAGWASGRLFKTKTIKDIVSTANSTIDLYESRETALEGKLEQYEAKIDELEAKIDSLQSSLDRALAQNEVLQNLLLRMGPAGVQVSIGEQVHGSGTSTPPLSA